jgi:hypothetical protein
MEMPKRLRWDAYCQMIEKKKQEAACDDGMPLPDHKWRARREGIDQTHQESC